MSLSPRAAALVDQLIQELGLQALRPESMEIHFDKQGVAQKVKPKLNFERTNSVDSDRNSCAT